MPTRGLRIVKMIKADIYVTSFEGRPNKIGTVRAVKTNGGDLEEGDYSYEILGQSGNLLKEGELKGFNRRRGGFQLISELLRDSPNLDDIFKTNALSDLAAFEDKNEEKNI